MDAFPVANHVLWRANKDAADITPMKLQKIVYFLHGWYLAITGQKLIDEGFARWQYGPVIPSLYRELKKYGSSPIDDYIKQYDPASASFVPFFVNTSALPRFNDILEQVWAKYSGYNAIQLSSMTHLPGTPWAITLPNEDIDDDVIQQYFVSQAFQNQQQAHE
jgi:uncharacterized phage-associated protein